MKLDSYKKLLALGCFGRKQAEALWRENASKYLDDALKQGLIRRVRKDLYVPVSLETHQPTVNKFEIASRVPRPPAFPITRLWSFTDTPIRSFTI